MTKNNIARIQIFLAIVVAVYVFMPDLVIGPLDDTAVATIAGIVELILSIMRSNSKSDPDRMSDGFDGYETY